VPLYEAVPHAYAPQERNRCARVVQVRPDNPERIQEVLDTGST
jgi:hypothetical protein